MYKTIVVGTDGSQRAEIAVHQAIVLAKMSSATLHIVHAGGPVSSESLAATMVVEANMLYDQGDQICAQALAEARREGVSAEMHSPVGDPADALIKIAELEDADLVVVGSQGMTGLKRFVLGSVPNRVSHRCPCSLLIVDTNSASARPD